MTAAIKSITMPEIDGLIARMREAIEHELALSQADISLLLEALLSLVQLQLHMQDKDITLHKLRKLAGMVKASEKLRDLLVTAQTPEDPAAASKPASDSKQRDQRKSTAPPAPPAPPVAPRVEHHSLETLRKGDECPACFSGTLYKYDPASFLRIEGQSPFAPVLYLSERLRCNTCGEFFTAELPAQALRDGARGQKYGFSARALMAILKYFAGTPFYRQGSVQQLLGVAISASTIFDQCEYLADDCQLMYKTLTSLAANARQYHIDDTGNRILAQKPVSRASRSDGVKRTRSGVYTSGLIACLDDGRRIVLYQTSIGHAGELLDDVLKLRSRNRAPPILMSDALPSNHVSQVTLEKSLCNAHGRRQFVDVLNHEPVLVPWVLERYKLIWRHEDTAREQGLSAAERLVYHQQHSLPVMAELLAWGQSQLEQRLVEANSGLGKAIAYFTQHYEGLTAFCRIEEAALDNNSMEQLLKLVVRNRKNASFFKTAAGAGVADVLTSIIATASLGGVNALDYLTVLQRHKAQYRLDPGKWLPWNYTENALA